MAVTRSKSNESKSVTRPSLLVHLKIVDKQGFPLDEEVAWKALTAAFEAHPYLRIEKALIQPDKEDSTSL